MIGTGPSMLMRVEAGSSCLYRRSRDCSRNGVGAALLNDTSIAPGVHHYERVVSRSMRCSQSLLGRLGIAGLNHLVLILPLARSCSEFQCTLDGSVQPSGAKFVLLDWWPA